MNGAGGSTVLRAFVSSTYEDLREHRAYVIDRLRHCGLFVDPMEDWTADTGAPVGFSQARVDGCDVCILLVALRRGYVPGTGGNGQSITQMEYARACALDIDVLVFLLNEDALWRIRFDERATDPLVAEWRALLKATKGVGYFDHRPDSIDIEAALFRWMARKMDALKKMAGQVHDSASLVGTRIR